MKNRLVVFIAAIAMLVTVVGCGGVETLAVEATRDLAYATSAAGTFRLDMFAPVEPGEWPIVIHYPGAAGTSAPAWLTEDVAARGAVVFVLQYPLGGPGSLLSGDGAVFRAYGDSAACAIRFARARASEMGSTDPRVVITGFSWGAGIASHAALFGDALDSSWDGMADAGGPERQVRCEVAGGATGVDGLVGIGGSYDVFWGYEGFHEAGWMEKQNPDLWSRVEGRLRSRPDTKVRLVHGTADATISHDVSVAFESILSEAGFDVELALFDGGHGTPEDPAMEYVLELIEG